MNKNSDKTHTQLTVRLPNDVLQQIEKLANKEYRVRNNMIEFLLREALKGKVKE